jgi:hypothetical protein
MAKDQDEFDDIGFVRQARWGEWEAVCTVARCGWMFSQGNRTREVAEKHMRGHAAICHPPRIPVSRTQRPATLTMPPRVGEVVTVADGTVRTVESLCPEGHYRITLDVVIPPAGGAS